MTDAPIYNVVQAFCRTHLGQDCRAPFAMGEAFAHIAKVSLDLRNEAAGWCSRLAHDRSQSSWSIRFTPADIASSPATQLAWQAHCAIKEQLGRDTPPRILWTKAEVLLRGEWSKPPPTPKIVLPKPIPKAAPPKKALPPPPAKKTLPSPPPAPTKKKESMAKRQTRRTISVSRSMYERAKTFAQEKGVPLSQLTETALVHAIEHFYRSSSGAKR